MGEIKPKPRTSLLIAVAGWIHRKQLDVIEYVREKTAFSGSSSATSGSG